MDVGMLSAKICVVARRDGVYHSRQIGLRNEIYCLTAETSSSLSCYSAEFTMYKTENP